MAVSYLSCYADVLSQINSLAATSVTVAQTAYAAAVGGTIVDADMRSTDWATGQIQAAILDAEIELIKEVCFNGRHPERGAFRKTSSALASGAAVPAAASDTTPFIGQFDYATDSSTGLILTRRPQQVVQWAINDAASAFSNPRVLVWCVAGSSILHNGATTIVVVGPGATRNTFSGNMRLLDYHRAAVVAGALTKLLPKEGVWMDAYQANGTYYTAHITQIRGVGAQVGEPLPGQFQQ